MLSREVKVADPSSVSKGAPTVNTANSLIQSDLNNPLSAREYIGPSDDASGSDQGWQNIQQGSLDRPDLDATTPTPHSNIKINLNQLPNANNLNNNAPENIDFANNAHPSSDISTHTSPLPNISSQPIDELNIANQQDTQSNIQRGTPDQTLTNTHTDTSINTSINNDDDDDGEDVDSSNSTHDINNDGGTDDDDDDSTDDDGTNSSDNAHGTDNDEDTGGDDDDDSTDDDSTNSSNKTYGIDNDEDTGGDDDDDSTDDDGNDSRHGKDDNSDLDVGIGVNGLDGVLGVDHAPLNFEPGNNHEHNHEGLFDTKAPISSSEERDHNRDFLDPSTTAKIEVVDSEEHEPYSDSNAGLANVDTNLTTGIGISGGVLDSKTQHDIHIEQSSNQLDISSHDVHIDNNIASGLSDDVSNSLHIEEEIGDHPEILGLIGNYEIEHPISSPDPLADWVMITQEDASAMSMAPTEIPNPPDTGSDIGYHSDLPLDHNHHGEH